MTTKIEQIMTKDPIFVSQLANVHKARMLMATSKIRHLPVKNANSGELIGLLTQKAVLANAIKIINQKGSEQLQHSEKSISVESIMDKSLAVFDVSSELIDVANSLLDQKNGCVAIEQDRNLVGIITSNDFVKLAVQQLS